MIGVEGILLVRFEKQIVRRTAKVAKKAGLD